MRLTLQSYRISILLIVVGLFGAASPSGAYLLDRKVPLSLNVVNDIDRSADKNTKTYMIALRKRIESLWVPKPLQPKMQAKVLFRLTADGNLQDIRVKRSSGMPVFDARAMNAIKQNAPYPPLGQALEIEAEFNSKYLDDETVRANARRYLALKGNITKSAPPVETQPAPVPEKPYNAEAIPESLSTQQPDMGSDSRGGALVQISSTSSWVTPQSSSIVMTFDDANRKAYIAWFTDWLKRPISEKYGFLSGIMPATTEKSNAKIPNTKPARSGSFNSDLNNLRGR